MTNLLTSRRYEYSSLIPYIYYMIRNFIREVFHSEQWKEYSKTTPVHVDDEKPHAQKQMRIILDSLTDENVTQLRKDCIDAFPHNRNINNYVNSLKYKDGFSDTEISLLAHLVWLRNYDAQE